MDTFDYAIDKIPDWLIATPTASVYPPVETRAQKLPFGELSWENFERLCLRLAQIDSNTEHCRLYGVQGDRQHGIDIYARMNSEDRYFVYQCKREQIFTPAKIKAAVTKFIDGEWLHKTNKFVLCTQKTLRNANRARQLEEQISRLRKLGVTLIAWDDEELARLLKTNPLLVDDFFGRTWTERFCGEDAAKSLGRRLDIVKSLEYRKQMASFYERVFSDHDPGIPEIGLFDTNRIPLQRRFVVPDLLVQEQQTMTRSIQHVGFSKDMFQTSPTAESSNQRFNSETTETVVGAIRRRIPLDELLGMEANTVILGPPGAGKSTLLRFIALDLLSDSPKLTHLARSRAGALPVWIPFPLWVKRLASRVTEDYSLADLLKTWFHSYDEDKLWNLVQDALDDKRLLLLVDGLDEWSSSNTDAAKLAIHRLNVFVEQRNVPSILVSRPLGFQRLAFPIGSWRTVELAELNDQQRHELVNLWFRIKDEREPTPLPSIKSTRIAENESDLFLVELRHAPGLARLSRNPLLISLLIHHRFRNARLPHTRFKAYESLAGQMLSTHPQRRRLAAGQTESPSLSDTDVRRLLEYLAYQMQIIEGEGILDINEAKRLLEVILSDPNGTYAFSQREVRTHANDFIDTIQEVSGLLVERSPGTLGFFHRCLQEYLAAAYLASLPPHEQTAVLEQHGTEPQWQEVILGLFNLCRSSEQTRELVKILQNRKDTANPYEIHLLDILLSEIACGETNCPASLAREIVDDAIREIELCYWPPKQRQLLKTILGGLYIPCIRDQILSKVYEWFPARLHWRSYLFREMLQWPQRDVVTARLLANLYGDDFTNQHAAAHALSTIVKEDNVMAAELVRIVNNYPSPQVQAAALLALSLADSNQADMGSIIRYARNSGSPDMRAAAILARVRRGEHTSEDEEELIHLGEWRSAAHYSWSRDIGDALLAGWPKSARIKEACFASMERTWPRKIEIQFKEALRILIEGYVDDPDVRQLCLDEIASDSPFVSLHQEAWYLLRRYWAHDLGIIDAIDKYISSSAPRGYLQEAATLVGCTDLGKVHLLKALRDDSRLCRAAMTLLEGWGMEDIVIAEALQEIAFGDNERASMIGHLLPKIIVNQQDCRKRLLNLLHSASTGEGEKHKWRVAHILLGLSQLGTTDDNEGAELGLSARILFQNSHSDPTDALIRTYTWHPRIHALAIESIRTSNDHITSIAEVLGGDPIASTEISTTSWVLPDDLRMYLVDLVAGGGIPDDIAVDLLGKYRLEVNPEIKAQASAECHRLIYADGGTSEDLVPGLLSDVTAVGMGYDERRQAGLCGLLELGRFDAFLTTEEPYQRAVFCSVALEAQGEVNTRFVRCLLNNWESIKTQLGEEPWRRLNKWGSKDPAHFWTALCPIAADYPAARYDILEFLRSNLDKMQNPDVLKFLEKVEPRGELMRKLCLGMLHTGISLLDYTGAVEAAVIIGNYFAGDSEFLRVLLQMCSEGNREEALIWSLAEGWPLEAEVRAVLKSYITPELRVLPLTCMYLTCTLDQPRTVMMMFLCLRDSIDRFYHSLRFVARPLIRRLKNDEELATNLWAHLQTTDDSFARISIPPLLAAARGLSPELREWCMNELTKQARKSARPEADFDLLTSSYRSMPVVLLDILHAGAEAQ